MPNPHLKRVLPEELPEDIHSAWQNSMNLRGDATFFEVFANHPTLYNWYTKSFYGEVFNQGKVDLEIKQLIRYRLSTVHGCKFCNQGNSAEALAAGVSQEKIDAINDYANGSSDNSFSGPFDDREKAALKLADQLVLTNPEGVLSKELYNELKHHFDDAEVLELGLVLGILSGVAKFIFAFDLVEKETTCPFNPENR